MTVIRGEYRVLGADAPDGDSIRFYLGAADAWKGPACAGLPMRRRCAVAPGGHDALETHYTHGR
jgi:hypothetical protein